MSLINISELTFCYDGSYDNVFENVSFQIDTDWRLGFTGRNGRGKTTFLKLLMGEYAYRGSISASVEFEYFPYPVDDKSRLTADVLSSIDRNAADWRLIRELNKLQVGEDVLSRPFSTLSNGEQTKVLLAALFLRENSFLLIDEPTNHLDLLGRQTVARYLAGKSDFILVSHDRAFLDECVDHILSINKADIEVQKGGFSSWYYNKQLKDSYELGENRKLTKEVKRLSRTASEKADWSDRVEKTKLGAGDRGYVGHQSAKLMKRAKAIERRRENAVEEKSKLLKNIETTESLKLSPETHHSERLVELTDVSISYGGNAVISELNLRIGRGERIALTGRNGCGKSSILKLICGENIEHTGDVFRASGLKISYMPQDTSGLSGSLDGYANGYGIDISLFKTILRKLGFERVQFEKPMESYSAGQKKKVLAARSLCERAHLYIWDEPLNYIDVLSRMQIEELLSEYRPTLLLVEHDRAFVDNIATRVITL